MNIRKKTVYTVKIAALSACAFILMLFDFPLPAFPMFLKLDLSDVPALIAAFGLGPASGAVVELVKNLLHLFVSSSIGIGELANFIVGASFAVTAGFVYRYKKTKKGALLSLAAATLAMTLIASLANYYFLIPAYQAFLKFPDARNSLIVDIRTLVAYGVIPFNLIKGVVISLVVLVLYKKVSPVLHRE